MGQTRMIPLLPLLAGLVLLALSTQAYADELKARVLPLRERAELIDNILQQRLDSVVPQVMRRNGVDAWILIAREYNEDPVLKTMLPATWLNARRRTVLLFVDHGAERGVERMAIARYPVGTLFPGVWNPDEDPDQWRRIAQILDEFDPHAIALNYSRDFALADGLSYSEQQDFMAALPPRPASKRGKWRKRTTRATLSTFWPSRWSR